MLEGNELQFIALGIILYKLVREWIGEVLDCWGLLPDDISLI